MRFPSLGSSTSPRIERRRSLRFEGQVPLRLASHRSLGEQILNLSRGGIALSTRAPLSVGEEVQLTIQLSVGSSLKRQATVIWCRPAQGDDSSDVMGLKYTDELSQCNASTYSNLLNRLGSADGLSERPLHAGALLNS